MKGSKRVDLIAADKPPANLAKSPALGSVERRSARIGHYDLRQTGTMS